MKKIISFVLFIICTASSTASSQEDYSFRINVLNINDLGRYKQLVTDAVSLINEVINSQEFKDDVMKFDFDWKDLGGDVRQTMPNEQIFDTLYRWTKIANINLYFKHRGIRLGAYLSGTVGKTTIGENCTTTYVHWIDLSNENYRCTLLMYASHIAHEFCHQRSFFDKDVSNQSIFRNVVPYAIGDLVCHHLNKKFGTSCACDR